MKKNNNNHKYRPEEDDESDGDVVEAKNYKGIYFGENEQKRFYEFGAQFFYKDLYQRLSKIAKQETLKSTTANSFDLQSLNENSNKEYISFKEVNSLKYIMNELMATNKPEINKVNKERDSYSTNKENKDNKTKLEIKNAFNKTSYKNFSIDRALQNQIKENSIKTRNANLNSGYINNLENAATLKISTYSQLNIDKGLKVTLKPTKKEIVMLNGKFVYD